MEKLFCPNNELAGCKWHKRSETKTRNRISISSCVIILSGIYAKYSRWIDYEIDIVISMGKPIIGLIPWGEKRIPLKILDNADVMIGWNSSPLIQTVRDHAI